MISDRDMRSAVSAWAAAEGRSGDVMTAEVKYCYTIRISTR